MMKKHYALAIASYLLIPVVTLLGGRLFCLIDPEAAVHTNHYVVIYHLIDLARRGIMLGLFFGTVGLWLLTCFLVLKSKRQSYGWMPLAVFGPFGFIILTLLKDNAEEPWDWYRRFVRKLNFLFRAVYEVCAVFALWNLAYGLMVLKRDLMIRHEAAVTGLSVQQILDQQNASSGMWAFTEGLEVLYFVVLLYLLWPVCVNLIAAAGSKWRAGGRAGRRTAAGRAPLTSPAGRESDFPPAPARSTIRPTRSES